MGNNFREHYLYFLARIYFILNKPQVIFVLDQEKTSPTALAIEDLLRKHFKLRFIRSSGQNAAQDIIFSVLSAKQNLLQAFIKAFGEDKSTVLLIHSTHESLGNLQTLGRMMRIKMVVVAGIKTYDLAKSNKLIEERVKLLNTILEGGYVILNLDYPPIKKLSYSKYWRKITYAQKSTADIMPAANKNFASDSAILAVLAVTKALNLDERTDSI